MSVDAKYIVLLVGAAIVLAFMLEFVAFVRYPLGPLDADESSYPKLNRRVLLRLVAAGGAAAFLLIVGIFAAYLVDRDRASLLVAWADKHPSSLLLFGAALYLIAFACGVKFRQPVFLLCLALPGLFVVPLILAADPFVNEGIVEGIVAAVLVFFFQPATWILLFIGIGQARLVHKPGGQFTAGGLVRLLLISIAYFFGLLI